LVQGPHLCSLFPLSVFFSHCCIPLVVKWLRQIYFVTSAEDLLPCQNLFFWCVSVLPSLGSRAVKFLVQAVFYPHICSAADLTVVGACALPVWWQSDPCETWFFPFLPCLSFGRRKDSSLAWVLGSAIRYSLRADFSRSQVRAQLRVLDPVAGCLSSVFCRLLLKRLRSLVLRSSLSLSFAQHRSVSVVSPTRFLPPPIGSCSWSSQIVFPTLRACPGLDFDSAAGLSVSCSIFLEIPLLRLRFAARQLILLLLLFPLAARSAHSVFLRSSCARIRS
jgi:hypothetical protein